jgi:aryl-alcohol dehydrogenase-like predicted oxidoreductase
MEFRYLGRSGVRVSELCLGAMSFGRESDERTSHAMLERFVEAGGNFIDTANVYSTGVSEEILGRWLAKHTRDDFVVATKVRWGMGPGPNDAGLSRKHIMRSLDDSLRRLGTDYIDLYQTHAWDPGTPIEETLATLDVLVRAGKVRYIGASNVLGWQLQKALDVAGSAGLERYVSLQPLYNLLDRTIEWEQLPVCSAEGVGVIPWSPLRGGWLSGKYRRGMTRPPQGTRIEMAESQGWSETFANYANERTWSVIDELLAVAEETGHTPAQVALRWVVQRPGVTAPIIGARDMAQLDDNLGATGWALDADAIERLTKVGAEPYPYPYPTVADPTRLRS